MKMPPFRGTQELTPAGNHVAICYKIVDFGTQELKPYQGVPRPPARMISIGWELPYAQMTEGEYRGRPFTFHTHRLPLSAHPKSTFRKAMTAWHGGEFADQAMMEFDPESLIAKRGMLNLSHRTGEDGRTHVNFGGIAPLPPGMPEPPQLYNVPIFFDLENFDPAIFERLQPWEREIIAASPEFMALGQRHQQVQQPAIQQVPQQAYRQAIQQAYQAVDTEGGSEFIPF